MRAGQKDFALTVYRAAPATPSITGKVIACLAEKGDMAALMAFTGQSGQRPDYLQLLQVRTRAQPAPAPPTLPVCMLAATRGMLSKYAPCRAVHAPILGPTYLLQLAVPTYQPTFRGWSGEMPLHFSQANCMEA